VRSGLFWGMKDLKRLFLDSAFTYALFWLKLGD